jgi:Transcriptional regulator
MNKTMNHQNQANVPSHDDTRHRLIMAGLMAFDQHGFEGASTRNIAASAGTNISSIAYHFGSKEKLYLAVAEYIADEIGAMVDELETDIGDDFVLLKEGRLPRDQAILLLRSLLKNWLADMFLGKEDRQKWSSFLFREQYNPTEAFELLYQKGIGRFLEILAHFFSCIEQKPATDLTVRYHAFSLFGQILALKIERASVKRFFGWSAIDKKTLGTLVDVVNCNIASLEH